MGRSQLRCQVKRHTKGEIARRSRMVAEIFVTVQLKIVSVLNPPFLTAAPHRRMNIISAMTVVAPPARRRERRSCADSSRLCCFLGEP